MRDSVFKDHAVQWSGIEREKQRTENGPLGDSKFETGFGGQTVTYLNPLVSTSKIRFKPVECLPSNPKPIIESIQQDSVIYGVRTEAGLRDGTHVSFRVSQKFQQGSSFVSYRMSIDEADTSFVNIVSFNCSSRFNKIHFNEAWGLCSGCDLPNWQGLLDTMDLIWRCLLASALRPLAAFVADLK